MTGRVLLAAGLIALAVASCRGFPCPDVCGALCRGEPDPFSPPGCPIPDCACPEDGGHVEDGGELIEGNAPDPLIEDPGPM